MFFDYQQGGDGGDVLMFADWNFGGGGAAVSVAVPAAQYGTIFLTGGGRTSVSLAGGAGPGFPATGSITTSTILDENGLVLLDETGVSILSDP